jgi:uncharacterized protein (DUF433 family)
MAATPIRLMTANEAASVTGVPLRQVHRIIDAGLLEGAVRRGGANGRLLPRQALVALKLAHQTANVLTLEGRRAVAAASIRSPQRSLIGVHSVVVDARPAAESVRSGLDRLGKSLAIVSVSRGVLGGTPVFKGTRIPVHDIADMLANGDKPAAIVKAYPQLDLMRIHLAAIYAQAYPRRGRPRSSLARRKSRNSEKLSFGDLASA